MINRELKKVLLELSKIVPIISVTGPRQSGKTTILKNVFSNYKYVNLENSIYQNMAKADPVNFLKSFESKLIIDEAQYVPEIFSAVQVISDETEQPGSFILSGSQNFLLSKNIHQSLAGRVAVIKLLPFTYNEVKNFKLSLQYKEFMIKGSYPRLYNSKLKPNMFYKSYIDTYISRDVKEVVDIRNIDDYLNLLTLLASRSGQLLNYSSLAKTLGIDVRTIKSWISVLEASYIVYKINPYYKNLTKSVVKTPKIYFYDTGLLCYLLNVRNVSDFELKGFKGQIFENFVISELIKHYYNNCYYDRIFFYRDKNKLEVDIVDNSYEAKYQYCEIKAGDTYHNYFKSNILKLANKKLIDIDKSCVIYGGIGSFIDENVKILGFNEWLETLN